MQGLYDFMKKLEITAKHWHPAEHLQFQKEIYDQCVNIREFIEKTLLQEHGSDERVSSDLNQILETIKDLAKESYAGHWPRTYVNRDLKPENILEKCAEIEELVKKIVSQLEMELIEMTSDETVEISED